MTPSPLEVERSSSRVVADEVIASLFPQQDIERRQFLLDLVQKNPEFRKDDYEFLSTDERWASRV